MCICICICILCVCLSLPLSSPPPQHTHAYLLSLSLSFKHRYLQPSKTAVQAVGVGSCVVLVPLVALVWQLALFHAFLLYKGHTTYVRAYVYNMCVVVCNDIHARARERASSV